MKTLQNITEGFATCSVQVLKLENNTLFFTSVNGYMTIENKTSYHCKTSKTYTCETKFLAAIKRHLAKQ